MFLFHCNMNVVKVNDRHNIKQFRSYIHHTYINFQLQNDILNFLVLPSAIAHLNRYSLLFPNNEVTILHVCHGLLCLLMHAPKMPNTKCMRKFATSGSV